MRRSVQNDGRKMPRIERQLRLYELVCGYAITGFEVIEEVFPDSNKRMIRRDLKDLKDAGLVCVKYSRKGNGYIKEKEIPEFSQQAKPRRMAHLKRLNRLGRLMSELDNEDIPLWEKKDREEDGEIQEYLTAKDSYNQLFPGLSEQTRQRDFEVLRNIGYDVSYDHQDHYFRLDNFHLGWMEAPDVIDQDYLDGTWQARILCRSAAGVRGEAADG